MANNDNNGNTWQIMINIFTPLPQPIPSSTIDDEIFRLMHCFALVPASSDDCCIFPLCTILSFK